MKLLLSQCKWMVLSLRIAPVKVLLQEFVLSKGSFSNFKQLGFVCKARSSQPCCYSVRHDASQFMLQSLKKKKKKIQECGLWIRRHYFVLILDLCRLHSCLASIIVHLLKLLPFIRLEQIRLWVPQMMNITSVCVCALHTCAHTHAHIYMHTHYIHHYMNAHHFRPSKVHL